MEALKNPTRDFTSYLSVFDLNEAELKYYKEQIAKKDPELPLALEEITEKDLRDLFILSAKVDELTKNGISFYVHYRRIIDKTIVMYVENNPDLNLSTEELKKVIITKVEFPDFDQLTNSTLHYFSNIKKPSGIINLGVSFYRLIDELLEHNPKLRSHLLSIYTFLIMRGDQYLKEHYFSKKKRPRSE